ncbi:MAG: 50S ribosomal protein L29 [Symploca sp. SIO1B1]|nr:50S ribosomal protein L29 [Symploca sp. SIO1B1]
MPLPKIEEVRKLNDQELADEILAAKRELFELRLQQATRRLEKPHQFKHLRHRIAQMLTVERERQLAAEQTPTDTPTMNEAPPSEETEQEQE